MPFIIRIHYTESTLVCVSLGIMNINYGYKIVVGDGIVVKNAYCAIVGITFYSAFFWRWASLLVDFNIILPSNKI